MSWIYFCLSFILPILPLFYLVIRFCFKVGTFIFLTFDLWQIFKIYELIIFLGFLTTVSAVNVVFSPHRMSCHCMFLLTCSLVCACNSQYLVLIYGYHVFWSKKVLLSPDDLAKFLEFPILFLTNSSIFGTKNENLFLANILILINSHRNKSN